MRTPTTPDKTLGPTASHAGSRSADVPSSRVVRCAAHRKWRVHSLQYDQLARPKPDSASAQSGTLTHSSRCCSVTTGLRHTSLKVPSSASLIDARIALTYMTPSPAPALLLLLTLVVLVTRSSISWFRSSMSAGNPVETRHIAGAWRPRFPSAPRAPRLHGA